MENLIYLVFLLALGKLSRRLSVFPENTPNVLNQFVIYISFPATVLLKINGIDIQTDLLVLALVPWVLVFLSIFAVKMISKFLHWDKKLTGAVMLSVALGNTSFFGFPAVSAFFGENSLGYAIIYDQLGSFIALATFGTLVVSVYGTSQKISLKTILFKIIGFPPFIALVAGFILVKTPIPLMILKMIEGLSATLIPLVIFSVGTQLKFRQPLSNVKPICITIVLKMIVSPFIAILILMAMGIQGPVFNISVFEAAMPSMVMSGILAAAGNLRADVANAAIGYGILFSFITLPVLYYILGFLQ
ncbi:MAG: AEC family transporter [Proteobacteria bacterium]|nr:AEC family transporter [Pseudomonadota bacterium]MBU1583278.1 AEC family transporter [Pseudomonadota bacterium]MBU2631669.1 AEC family transporter [Pseudomonadota bacterium]